MDVASVNLHKTSDEEMNLTCANGRGAACESTNLGTKIALMQASKIMERLPRILRLVWPRCDCKIAQCGAQYAAQHLCRMRQCFVQLAA